MTIESFSGVVNTAGDWSTVASEASMTLSSGTSYLFYIVGQAEIKIGSFVAPYFNEKFTLKAGSEDIYIKTGANNVTLSVLELE